MAAKAAIASVIQVFWKNTKLIPATKEMNITVGVQSPKNFLSPDSGQNENKSTVRSHFDKDFITGPLETTAASYNITQNTFLFLAK